MWKKTREASPYATGCISTRDCFYVWKPFKLFINSATSMLVAGSGAEVNTSDLWWLEERCMFNITQDKLLFPSAKNLSTLPCNKRLRAEYQKTWAFITTDQTVRKTYPAFSTSVISTSVFGSAFSLSADLEGERNIPIPFCQSGVGLGHTGLPPAYLAAAFPTYHTTKVAS